MSTEGSGTTAGYRLITPVMLNQAAAVQNTWYTVADLSGDLAIHWAMMRMNTADETLEYKMTIDGVTYTAAGANATLGTNYYCTLFGSASLGYNATFSSTLIYSPIGHDALYCRAFKLEVRKTTANGANALLGSVFYARR